MAKRYDTDVKLAQDGRVMEMLSEHQCQGWLEGYLLTGRHGLASKNFRLFSPDEKVDSASAAGARHLHGISAVVGKLQVFE